MTPAPKAISQGSNAAGAGAAGALRGISAANDEPPVTASTAAAKTSFCMTIPTTLKTAQLRRPEGKAITDCRQIPERHGNLVWAARHQKQKRSSSADFLGFIAIKRNVAAGVLYSDNNFDWSWSRFGNSWDMAGRDVTGRSE